MNQIALSKEESFAEELAAGLNDIANLNFYLSITSKYHEQFLRNIYEYVRSIPDEKIKKTRGALFNYLLQIKTQKTPTTNENKNNNCD
jgi:hypothetical protein